MEITNFSIINPIFRRHHNLLPRHLRALIVGKSASGKSTLLYNLLLKPWLDYDNLLVFGNSLHQSEYRIIKSGFEHGLGKEQIANVFRNQEQLLDAGISPTRAIEEYTGPKDNDKLIPDPTTVTSVNRIKRRRIAPEAGTITVILYSFLKIISDFLDKL